MLKISVPIFKRKFWKFQNISNLQSLDDLELGYGNSDSSDLYYLYFKLTWTFFFFKLQGVCAILIFNKYTYFWQFAYLNLLSMWKYTYFQPKWMKRQKLGNIGEIGLILDGDTLINTDMEKLFAIYEVSWYFNDFLLIFIHEIICSA